MNKRLEMLESMTQSPGADAFAWYGLAMEYRRLERLDEALEAFHTLRREHPQYLAMYLMAGQMLLSQGRRQDAADWLRDGLKLAAEQGNSQAEGELADALAECESP